MIFNVLWINDPDTPPIEKGCLDILREMGWEDRDIFDAVNHAARMLSTDILFNAFRIEDYRG